MPQERKIWPSATDREPLSAVLHVQRSCLGDEQRASGASRIQVTEGSQQVETRLREQFLAYRIVKQGGELMKRIGAQHEV